MAFKIQCSIYINFSQGDLIVVCIQMGLYGLKIARNRIDRSI